MPDRPPGPGKMTEETARVPSHPARRLRGASGVEVAESGKISRLREERVQEDEKEKKPAHRQELPLKKGGDRLEMVDARAWEEMLRRLLEREPERFQALRAIVEGRPDEASPQHRRDLRSRGYLSRDGSPHPRVKTVLAAALRDTPDGPAIVDPFDVRSTEDAAALRQADDQLAAFKRKMEKRVLRDMKRLKDEDDKDKGVGR
jgi:hypothetical protein